MTNEEHKELSRLLNKYMDAITVDSTYPGKLQDAAVNARTALAAFCRADTEYYEQRSTALSNIPDDISELDPDV